MHFGSPYGKPGSRGADTAPVPDLQWSGRDACKGVLVTETLILIVSPGSCSAEITSAPHFLYTGSSPSRSAAHMEHAQGKPPNRPDSGMLTAQSHLLLR